MLLPLLSPLLWQTTGFATNCDEEMSVLLVGEKTTYRPDPHVRLHSGIRSRSTKVKGREKSHWDYLNTLVLITILNFKPNINSHSFVFFFLDRIATYFAQGLLMAG